MNKQDQSQVVRMDQATSWNRALNAARRTVGKTPLSKEPSDSFKKMVILAEHSPIRLVEYDWTWKDIPMWVTTHIVRHHEGCEKFVHTQREDRRELSVPRDELSQGELNDMDMTANVQALINISRKRLCANASPETRHAWKNVVEEIRKIDPILAEKLVPECIYRGFCPEIHKCGYANTKKFQEDLKKYRSVD